MDGSLIITFGVFGDTLLHFTALYCTALQVHCNALHYTALCRLTRPTTPTVTPSADILYWGSPSIMRGRLANEEERRRMEEEGEGRRRRRRGEKGSYVRRRMRREDQHRAMRSCRRGRRIEGEGEWGGDWIGKFVSDKKSFQRGCRPCLPFSFQRARMDLLARVDYIIGQNGPASRPGWTLYWASMDLLVDMPAGQGQGQGGFLVCQGGWWPRQAMEPGERRSRTLPCCYNCHLFYFIAKYNISVHSRLHFILVPDRKEMNKFLPILPE